jgi:hypothetical protein
MDFDSGLLQLWTMLDDSVSNSDALRLEAETLRTGLESWQTKALNWSSELTASRLESEALETSLEDSSRREALASLAAEERARLDQVAIDRARGEASGWKWAAGGAGVVAILALVWGAVR